MQDIKCRKKKENSLKGKNQDNYQDSSNISTQTLPTKNEKNKSTNDFLGKKISGDAELISWLIGV